jgi:hypothetical protein
MKTKHLFLRFTMIIILSVSAIGLWAQSTTDPDHACLNSLEDYWVINTPGSTYDWILSGGGTITTGQGSNQISINWTLTGDYTLTVTETFTSTTGCEGVPVMLNIIVDPLPIITLNGPSPVCVNSTGNVYTTESGMTDYLWDVSAGGTITAGGGMNDNTVTITWDIDAPQTVSVNYTNGTNCTAASPEVFDVTVNPLPTTSPIWHN